LLNANDDYTRKFVGYYRNEAASKKKLVTNVLKSGDSFFRTGDVIKIHQDSFNRFTLFEDRIGDTFRWKGENVSTMVPPLII
jgi:acyl-CoA synthetase (AMP-forming)/AMP-acid ligase II